MSDLFPLFYLEPWNRIAAGWVIAPACARALDSLSTWIVTTKPALKAFLLCRIRVYAWGIGLSLVFSGIRTIGICNGQV